MSDAAAAPAAPVAQPGNAPVGINGAPVPTPQQVPADGTGPQRDATGKFVGKEGKPPEPKPKLRIKDLELDEEAAHSEIMRARALNKKFGEVAKEAEEAKRIRAEREAFREELKRDKHRALTKMLKAEGFDADSIAEMLSGALYEEHIAPQEMTPEQRELAQLKRQLAEREAKEKQAEEAAQKERLTAEETQYAEQLQSEIGEAMQAGRLPQSPWAVREVALELENLERRGLSVPLDVVIARVKERGTQQMAEVIGGVEVDDLREMMPPEAFKALVVKFNRWLAAKRQSLNAQAAPKQPPASPPKPRQYLTPDQYLAMQRGQK